MILLPRVSRVPRSTYLILTLFCKLGDHPRLSFLSSRSGIDSYSDVDCGCYYCTSDTTLLPRNHIEECSRIDSTSLEYNYRRFSRRKPRMLLCHGYVSPFRGTLFCKIETLLQTVIPGSLRIPRTSAMSPQKPITWQLAKCTTSWTVPYRLPFP